MILILKKSLLIISVFSLSCCGTKKISATQNTKEIVLPITNFTSDKTYFRSIAQGTSPDMSFAKELAFKNGVSEIAKLLNVKVKSFIEDYAKQDNIDGNIDFKSEVERMQNNSTEQSISNIVIAQEKVFQNPDKTYTYWLGLQLSKEDISNAINKQISNSKIKALHQDKVEFRETFNKNFNDN